LIWVSACCFAVSGKGDRDLLMNSVAPVWDGNETWLVLGGGGLFAAFPMAYGIYMTALYTPIIAMLLALVFRGVAFEYRWRTRRWERWWDRAFIVGSLVASLAQGIALGAILQGIAVDGRQLRRWLVRLADAVLRCSPALPWFSATRSSVPAG
jgi:cytochrome d oxidase subunit CydB